MSSGVTLKGFIKKGIPMKAKTVQTQDEPTFSGITPSNPTKPVRGMFSRPEVEKSTKPIIPTVSFLPEQKEKEEGKKEKEKERKKAVKEAKTELTEEYGATLEKLGQLIVNEEETDPYENEVPDAYVPETRKGFSKFIKYEYEDFKLKPISEQTPTPAGDKYPYQKFIREYMRQGSPYRGVLVYHGLGSGKTCTAIAASEALFSSSNKKIIVMTPKSLRKTFLKEITFCGFRHFRLQNYWIALDKSDPTIRLFAKNVLNISDNHLKKANHIWVPDFDQPPNYNTYSSDEQTEIREQILSILVYDEKTNPTGRIRFINYNGISAASLKNMACNNPTFFDDSVIIIDEIHNVIRLMQGKLEPYLVNRPTVSRKISIEPIGVEGWKPSLCYSNLNYARGYMFYRLLLAAKNTKIIGLSGTPLINFPEELGILSNVLHGYIALIQGVISSKSTSKTEEQVKTLLENFSYTDFVRVENDIAGGGIKFVCSLLPEGIKKVSNSEGVVRIAEGIKVPSRTEILTEFIDMIRENNFEFSTKATMRAVPLLPAFGEDFATYFLDKDRLDIKNKIVLTKRLSGLISYYKGSREDLMPKVLSDEVVRIPMSHYQQTQYMFERELEIKKDKEKKKGKIELWAEISEIANMKNSTNYRMTSRQICNFAFPASVNRPRAKNQVELDTEAPNVKNIIDTEYDFDRADGEAGIPGEDEEVEEVEEDMDGGQPKTMKEAIAERKRTQFVKDCKNGPKGESYKDAIVRSKDCLVSDPNILSLDGSLPTLSPKFTKILKNIKAANGSSLVYSQFLDMEGIGIFRLAMDANGYAPIEIITTTSGPKFSENTVQSFKTKQPRYITFSGAETDDIRRLALDVFNARFNELPENLSKVLEESGYKDNSVGQICRVFCITSAGAEGLSLKNVRAVHIMEPYWNDVRLKQVKGRAIRIGSHLELPEEERNVSIFTYVSVFGPEAQKAKSGEMKIDEAIVLSDSIERNEAVEARIPVPEDIRNYTLTSDERLYVISERKKAIVNELELIMKSAAVDCELNYAENKDGSFYCLKLEGNVGDYLYHPEIDRDIAESESKHKLVTRVEQKVVRKFEYDNILYSAILNEDKYIVYMRDKLEKPIGEMASKNGKPALPIVFY